MTPVLATTLLHNPDPLVRRSAVEALHPDACSDEGERLAAIESLVCVLSDPDVAVQETAMAALVTFDSCHVATHLLPVLHGTVQHRNLAVEVLQQLGPTALPVFFRALPDSDEHIRKFIVDIVGNIGGPAAVDGLLGLVHDSSSNVRAAVVESLGVLGDHRAVASIIRMVQDPEEWVMFSAISALGSLADVEAVPILQSLLSVEENAIRCVAVEALGKIGDPQVLPKLLMMLPTARIPLRHLLFVTIIELVGDQAEVFQRAEMRDYLFTELVQALNAREPEVQLAALHGLRLIGNTRATGALLSFLDGHRAGEEEIETAVLHALTHIGDEEELLQEAMNGSERVALLCIDALSNRRVTHAVPALSQLVVHSENREIRRAALVALGRIGIEESGESAVLVALQDYSGCVRKEAARIVAEKNIQDAGQALWSRLDLEPYPDVLIEQVRAIVNLECQDQVTILQGLLDHHRPEVREAAIAHWPDIHDPMVRQLLDDHVDDSDWHVRLSIVERLVVEQDETLLDMFIAASADPHPYVRQAAVQALGQFSGEAVCVTLRTAVIKDPDMWVRTRAVEQLVKLHDVDACQMLTHILKDSPVPLQIAIVRALGAIGNSSVVEILREMQSHEESEIEEAAFSALRQLTTPIAPPEVPA